MPSALTSAVGAVAVGGAAYGMYRLYKIMTGGPPMKKTSAVVLAGLSVNGEAPNLPKMADNESEKNSATWLDDLGFSLVPGKEMTSGLFRMNKGNALEYTYDCESAGSNASLIATCRVIAHTHVRPQTRS